MNFGGFASDKCRVSALTTMPTYLCQRKEEAGSSDPGAALAQLFGEGSNRS
jgi:hypothetical protein